MAVCTTRKTVIFENSFTLGDFDEVLPPGAYDVETDEELLEGLSFHAYRRVLTLIHLPARPGQRGVSRTLTIDPDDLDAALKRDEASNTAVSGRAPVNKPSESTPKTREVENDGRALDRALDRAVGEGMIGSSH